MTKQTINVGTTANDKKGDSLRAAFQKVNANFTELYVALGLDSGGLNLGAFEFTGSTLSTTDSSSIIIDQATTVTSNLSVGGDLLPQTANGGDLGSSSLPWRSLYVSNNTIYIGGTAVGVDANGNLTAGGTAVGSTPAWANITGKPTFATVATSGAYADLTGKPTIPTDFKGSVFADDSTLMIDAVDNKIFATELTAAVGNFVNVNSNNVDVENINGLSQQIHLSVGGNTSLVIENNLVTIQNVSLAVAGDITLGGDIRSEGNINIDINLTDSTLRRWTFGEDGVLNVPGDVVRNGSPGLTLGASHSVYIVGDRGDNNRTWTFDGSSGDLLLPNGAELGDDGNDVGNTELRVPAGGAPKVWSFDIDGNLTVPGNLQSNGNINIEINLADSTKRIWQFGEDGDFTIPGNLIYGGDTIHTKESTTTAGNPLTVRAGDSETQVGGNLILRGGDTIGSVGTPRNSGWAVLRAGSTVTGNGGYAELLGGNTTVGDGGQAYVTAGSATTGNGGPVEITAGDTVTGDGGSVTIESGEAVTGTAGNINITAKGTVTGDGGNINLNGGSATTGNGGAINLTAGDTISGGDPGTIRLRTFNAAAPQDWTFNFNGTLTFPDATVQNTAFTASPTLNVLKIDDGVHERFQTKTDATGTVQHNCALGHIFYHTSPDANWTANFTNLNLSSNYTTAVTLVIVKGGTGYYPSAVQIGGVAQTLNWQGNTTPTPSTNRTDVVTFSIINNSGTYTVLGQLTGF